VITIRPLQPGDEPALERFLLAHLDSSMFLLGNLRKAGLQNRDAPGSGYYVAAFAAGEIAGVVAHYWNGMLISQAPVHLDRLWREAATNSGRAVAGTVGPAAQVRVIRQGLGLAPDNLQMAEEEGLFALDLDHLCLPPALVNGAVHGRPLAAQDVDQVAAWRAAYNIEALGAADTPALYIESQATITRSLREGTTWVLEAAGALVASTSFNTTTAEAVQVGGVWTPPALRGRGYARAVVAASLRDAKTAGAQRAILFTGDTNQAAQKAYRALGFTRIGDFGLCLLQTPVMFTARSNQC